MSILTERLRTAVQDPRTKSIRRERFEELVRLREQNRLLRAIEERQAEIIAEQKKIIGWQRELLRAAEPCPACVAKGK